MVSHLHTVLWLFQKAPGNIAWLEYDAQFRMEMAASEDKTWTSGDLWQYITCLPGPSTIMDPFSLTEQSTNTSKESDIQPISVDDDIVQSSEGKNKRPWGSTTMKGVGTSRPPAKRPKRPGTCRLFNKAPAGCPYGQDCMFTHRCATCGTLGDHGAASCRMLPHRFPDNKAQFTQ